MADVKELLAYILINYPNKDDLSKTRVTKLIYLCDWKHCIEYGEQITTIEWIFDNYGPFVWDVMTTVNENPNLFRTEASLNFYGTEKLLLSIRNSLYMPNLETRELSTANFVINATKDLKWEQFIKLIYSTYPIIVSERFSVLDLPKLARQYKHSSVYKNISPELAA